MNQLSQNRPRCQRHAQPAYPYSEDEACEAYRQWGCNCGPSALATMLSLKPADVRDHIPDFARKGYTNPSMMAEALRSLGIVFRAGDQRLTNYGLVRIQFDGPWMKPGVPVGASYARTHWIGAMALKPAPKATDQTYVFDVNSGWTTSGEWEHTTIPQILKLYKGASGKWWPTHRWELIIN